MHQTSFSRFLWQKLPLTWIPLVLLLFLLTPLTAQILSGPMLGNNTMREVTIWLQTEEETTVQMNYWVSGAMERHRTDEYRSLASRGNTLQLVATDLQPGTEYQYELIIDGTTYKTEQPLTFTSQELWQYRSDPPSFSFVMGSCLYTNDPPFDRPGHPYGDTSEVIFESIHKASADFMLWLGDNIYLRTPDFDSHTGVYHRYTDFKSRSALQKL